MADVKPTTTADDKFHTEHPHDDDKRADKKTGKEAEDLTPTPTQAEMDKIMSGLSDEDLAKAKKPEAREGVEAHHPTPEENDLADARRTGRKRRGHDGSAAPWRRNTWPTRVRAGKKEREEKLFEDAETRRKKEMEAEHPAGYQTRATPPIHKK